MNYKNKIGEIDIIAKIKDTYVFVEVKSRETGEYGFGREAVTIHKQNTIRKVAEYFLIQNKLNDVSCRFDVIEIMGEKISHIENCF